MPGLKLYSSNRLEILSEKLALELEKPLKSPFDPEIIIVQSTGMRRWLSLELSSRLGVWANCRFLFPNIIAGEIFQAALPDLPESRIFEVETMTWRLMKIIPDCLADKSFDSIRNYLGNSAGSVKLYQLSSKLADVFDQYLTYRPEMILTWDRGQDSQWQAVLWRMLSGTLEHNHPPALLKSFLEKASDKKYMSGIPLPERISVFGISALPKFHMDVFASIAEYTDINLFLMNPSRLYWSDISTDISIVRSARKKQSGAADSDLYMEKGNYLLSSLGKTGRDFFGMMLKYFNPVEFSSFDEPPRDTILHTIQSDILDMIDRGAPGNEAPVQLSKEHLDNDNSIIISSCHSPSREVEVLYDYILDLFNTDKTIGPGDILIMTPDIETYSPYIQAVFGSNADGAANIPFSVTDISLRKEISVIETFISILDISESRFEASRIIGLLENDDIAMKFDLSAGDVEIIRRWIIDTNIRWGINADEKKKLGLPAERLNTWEDGFDRLLAGYALPSIDESLFNGILPFDNIEGSDARTLGRFIRFFDILKTTGADLNAERTLVEWRDVLIKLIDNLFFSNENSTEMQTLINLINRLSYIQEKSGFDGTIDPAVIKSFFNNYSRKESTGAGFLTGNVTFCTMLPMRSIPHRIIGLIGMNGDSFPRITRTPNFNLISADPEPGDRSQRSDDRYLFLESIISARDKLYISYVGQSIRDNSDIPPSVVVSELLDYIDQAFASPGIKMKNRMIFKHRLQPFSPEYFKADSRLFSYSEENFNACFSMLNEKKEPDPFITDSLDDSINKTDEISLKDLINFFLHPAKYLVQKRLGLYLEESPGIINDREPFNLDRLSGYKIAQEIIEHYIEGRDINSYYKMMRATGAIPHGNIGDAIFKDLIADSSVFADKIMPHISPGKNAANTFSIDVSGIRLSGEIENLFPKGFVIYRYADVRAKDMIRAWINHLFLNSTLKNNNFKNSYLLCRDKFYIFRPVPDSGRILTNLINLFFSGQNQLIQFLTETSYEYAFNLFKGKSAETAFDKAVVKWNGSEKIRGEFDDPYYYICFNKTKPFDENFRHLAEEIYIPLLKCAGEI